VCAVKLGEKSRRSGRAGPIEAFNRESGPPDAPTLPTDLLDTGIRPCPIGIQKVRARSGWRGQLI